MQVAYLIIIVYKTVDNYGSVALLASIEFITLKKHY